MRDRAFSITAVGTADREHSPRTAHLLCATVKVKPVKAVKANLTEPERGEIRKGSARGNLKRGERLSRIAALVSSLSCGFPSHPWRQWDEKNEISCMETIKVTIRRKLVRAFGLFGSL